MHPLIPPRHDAHIQGVPFSLLRAYDEPVPRYTSYPTALQFHDLEPQAVLRALEDNEAQAAQRPVSLYVHVPFCQSMCWYCGCTKVITTQRDVAQAFLDDLERELDLMAPHIRPERRVVQIHFGGGTPTYLTPDELTRLDAMLRAHFCLDPQVEYGVEIDPRRVTSEHLDALSRMGVNRASLGVQDVDERVQRAIHRIQPAQQTDDVIQGLRRVGIHSLNLDLIYGLPYQTVESYARTLEHVARWAPERLAVYSYAHVPWAMPSQKLLERHPMPDADEKLAIFASVVEALSAQGYDYIGLDHFARGPLVQAQREGTLRRNFQGYSTHQEADIYGFGPSSISQLGAAYLQNPRELSDWQQRVRQGQRTPHRGVLLTQDDQRRRDTIMRLMCDNGLDYAAMSERLGVDFAQHFAPQLLGLDRFERDGLLTRRPGGFELTFAGRLLMRPIAAIFDAYLDEARKRGAPTRHARAI